MASLESADYGEAVRRVRDSRLWFYFVYRKPLIDGKRIIDLTRAEMLRHEIMHDDETATSSFMTAAMREFARLEDANPDYREEWFRAVGTVSRALIETWRETRETAMSVGQITEAELDQRLANSDMTTVINAIMDQRLAEKDEK